MNIVNQNKCLICESKNIKDSIKLKDHSHTGECFSVVQCCECGFNFTQDAPDEESIGPYYKGENYISHSDTQKGFFFKIYHSYRLLILFNFIFLLYICRWCLIRIYYILV